MKRLASNPISLRIAAGKRRNEAFILTTIKKTGRFVTGPLMSIPLWNALERLESKLTIRYSRETHGFILITPKVLRHLKQRKKDGWDDRDLLRLAINSGDKIDDLTKRNRRI